MDMYLTLRASKFEKNNPQPNVFTVYFQYEWAPALISYTTLLASRSAFRNNVAHRVRRRRVPHAVHVFGNDKKVVGLTRFTDFSSNIRFLDLQQYSDAYVLVM